jgi:hypothetical protein
MPGAYVGLRVTQQMMFDGGSGMALRRLAITLLLVLAQADFAYAKWSISQISAAYAPSVVMVTALDENDQPLASGSGFFISGDGVVASVHHLFAGGSRVLIKTPDGRKGEVTEVIGDDPARDLLLARTSLRNTPPVTLGDSDIIQQGEEILGIGNSIGWEGILSAGTVASVWKGEGMEMIQMTAPILPGSSGGPVFNHAGEVIGVAVAFLRPGEDLYFAIPVNYLKRMKYNPFSLDALPKATAQPEATLRGHTLIELRFLKPQTAPVPPLPSEKARAYRPPDQAITDGDGGAHFTSRDVYFKNGRKLVCDRVWREGDAVFLVPRGKAYALGYPAAEVAISTTFRGLEE